MDVEVLPYCCHEFRQELERNGLFLYDFRFKTIPDKTAVIGNDVAIVLLQFKLLGKRKDAVKRTSAGKNDGQPSFLCFNEDFTTIRRYRLIGSQQSAVEVSSKEANHSSFSSFRMSVVAPMVTTEPFWRRMRS